MNPLQKLTSVFKSKPEAVKNELVTITDPVGFKSLTGRKNRVSKEVCIDPLEPDESYQGIVYAAITNRANSVATVMMEKLETQRRGVAIEEDHEYLNLISKDRNQTEYDFWYMISMMLDLTGNSFTKADRGVQNLKAGGKRVFKAKGFENLRSYYVTPKVDSQKNLVRWHYKKPGTSLGMDIEIEQMIHIKEANPFQEILGRSILEAAAIPAYLDRESGEYTAAALKNNLSTPGIIGLEEALDEPNLDNLYEALTQKFSGKRGVGKPVISNGSKMTFTDMRYDINKAALETIKNLSREELVAIFGVSKTLLGIEQSGVTRDTSKIQRQLYFENHIHPRARRIASAFNQDFRNYSPSSNKNYKLAVQKEVDPEQDKIRLEIEGIKLDNGRKAYELGVGLPYIQKEILGIDEKEIIFDHEPVLIGKEEESVVLAPRTAQSNNFKMVEETFNDVVQNAFKPAQYNLIIDSQEKLNKDVQKWQKGYMTKYLKDLKNTKKNALGKEDEDKLTEELITAISAFYLSVYPVMLRQHGQLNAKKYAKTFVETKLRASNNQAIAKRAKVIAQSHNKTVGDQLANLIINAEAKGLSNAKIARQVRDLFKDSISTAQASRIAVSETSFAFNETRHLDNLGFIERHSLGDRASYIWRTNSSNPDPICIDLNGTKVGVQAQYYTPGSDITAKGIDGKPVTVSSWKHSTGRPPVHPNCMCSIDLEIT